MNYNVLYLVSELPAPVIVMVISALIWKNPPCRSENVGYRTKRSQSSEQAWLYAQVVYGKLATIIFAIYTVFTAVLGVVGIFLNFGEKTGFVVLIVQCAVLVALLFVIVGVVESKLKAAFDEQGNPKGE